MRHRIARAEIDALAGDGDDATAVHMLRRSQLSRRQLLLRAVLDHAAERRRAADASGTAEAEEAFRLLARAQRTAPAIVDEILLHPPVGAWAGATLRGLRDAARPAEQVATDLCHLGTIAAAAALRAGLAFDLTVPVQSGRLVLPTLGSAELPGRGVTVAQLRHDEEGTSTVRWRSATLTLPGDLRRADHAWRPLPRLSATVVLDDVDPYRDYPGLTPATALPAAAVAGWRDLFAESWELLARHHEPLASSVAAGLSSIVPLDGSDVANVSGTSAEAFGAAAVSRPATGADLAAALVHEVQHSKLGAVLDLVPFVHEQAGQLLYAPWRDDPRPIGGLLHGCYAYFGITQFWRVQRRVATGHDADLAHMEFARWREQTWQTCLVLSRSGALTAPGRRFVAGMRHCLARWRREPVPPQPQRAAQLAALDHRIAWRLRNHRPDRAVVARLGRAWLAGDRCPVAGCVRSEVLAGEFSPPDATREQTPRRWLREPQTVAAAADGYRKEIVVAGRSDPAAWCGLALARAASGNARATGALHQCPEVVAAVFREIVATSGVAPDPDELARWLLPLVPGVE